MLSVCLASVDNIIMSYSNKSSKVGKRTHKIIFLGDSGVGKTCIIEKFATNRFDEFFNVPSQSLSQPSASTSWARTSSTRAPSVASSCGTLQVRKSSKAWFRRTCAMPCAACLYLTYRVIVVRGRAIEPEERVKLDWALQGEQEREGDFVNLRQQKRPRKVVVLWSRNFEKEQLEQLIEKYQIPYYCVSARTGSNLEELFFKIAEML